MSSAEQDMPPLALSIRGMTAGYGGPPIVRDVDMNVGSGRVVAVVGPNGAGKSTLLKAILGIARVQAGRVELNGADVTGVPLEKLARLGIGYVPQVDDVFDGLRVRENLDMGGYLFNRAEREERMERALEVFPQLKPRLNRYVETLSGGERKMTAIARVLMLDPSVLILDEPTAGLDPKQIIETRELIKELAGNHTIILSTHILPEVAQTCQRVVIINKGHVVAVDTPDNLTARLRGSETMYLQLDASGADAADALGRVPGVTRVVESDRRDGMVAYEIDSEQGRDVRRDLARAVISSGWGLLEMRPMRMSLEDVFLSLTTDETQAAAPEAGEPVEGEATHA